MAYTNENELRQALVAVRDRLAIKDKTEAQALVLSSTYPNCVYYTSDTHCIVIGGNIYGRGEQIVASNFAFLPASEPGPGHDPTFQDTTKIYVQPDSSNPGYFKLWWYLQSESTWINGGSFPLDIPLTAEDISYDLTPTPDLGTGDVQSAIEALDGKVEAVDARMIGYDVIDGIGVKNSWLKDSEETKILPIASGVHEYKSYKNIYASIASSLPRTTNITNSSNTPTFWNINSPQYTVTVGKYYLLIASLTIGEANDGKSGTLQLFPYKSGTNDLLGRTTSSSGGRNTVGAVVGTTYYLYQIFTPTQNTTCYSKIIAQGAGTSAQVFNFVINYLCCFECSTLAEANTLYLSRATLEQSGKDFDVDLFNPLYTEYYKKGVADGAGMASIAGLGYNVYDYISGAINLDGFEYGCELYRQYYPQFTGNIQNKFNGNTKIVYCPKFDFSVATASAGSLSVFRYATHLVVVPDLDYGSRSVSLAYSFDGCTNLVYVGDFKNCIINYVQQLFRNCSKLLHIGKMDWSSGGQYTFQGCTSLQRIEEINLEHLANSEGSFALTSQYNIFGVNATNSTLRYVVFKNFGMKSAHVGPFQFNYIPNWGVATAAQPDALQSLILTWNDYLFDRAGANETAKQAAIDAGTYDESTWTDPYPVCTVRFSGTVKNLLNTTTVNEQTLTEIITSKGYTIV